MYRAGLILTIVFVISIHFFYYPKWTKHHTEATISWDVSGYYMYLPAIFIYKDIKECKFKDEILKKYKPTYDFQQGFLHEASGNYVMKYSCGQAIMLSPGFAIAHLWAQNDSRYPADGFSHPYQFCISMWTLIIATIGLIFLWKILRVYFSEKVTLLGILGIVLGSNYIAYSAISGAMTHNTLFTLYAILIYLTIKFYRKPSLALAFGIGISVGFAALIRPTELISCLIPILWGLPSLTKTAFSQRLQFFKDHWKKLMLAVILVILVGSIQLMYWKYATGEFIVYSYEDQGFDWFSPHILDGLFSYRSGWLIYSPLMIFAVLGFIPLYKEKKAIFNSTFIFTCLFTYIAFAWSIWWYGGSLGQRTMVQIYPVLAFPLCAMIYIILNTSVLWKAISGIFIALFLYANFWFTHQAHLGGKMHVGRMSKAYFWETLFTYKMDRQDLKLLDHLRHLYKGEPQDIVEITKDTTTHILNSEIQFTPKITVPESALPEDYDWIRVEAEVLYTEKEWDIWKMTQLVLEPIADNKPIRRNMGRVHHQVDPNKQTVFYIDIKKPKVPFDRLETYFWHVKNDKKMTIKNTRVLTFKNE